MYMVMRGQVVTCTPFDLGGLGGLDWPLDHCGGWLGHQVAPQNYGGLTITLDHVSGVQNFLKFGPG